VLVSVLVVVDRDGAPASLDAWRQILDNALKATPIPSSTTPSNASA